MDMLWALGSGRTFENYPRYHKHIATKRDEPQATNLDEQDIINMFKGATQ